MSNIATLQYNKYENLKNCSLCSLFRIKEDFHSLVGTKVTDFQDSLRTQLSRHLRTTVDNIRDLTVRPGSIDVSPIIKTTKLRLSCRTIINRTTVSPLTIVRIGWIAPGRIEEKDEFSLFFNSSRFKIASTASKELNQCCPPNTSCGRSRSLDLQILG